MWTNLERGAQLCVDKMISDNDGPQTVDGLDRAPKPLDVFYSSSSRGVMTEDDATCCVSWLPTTLSTALHSNAIFEPNSVVALLRVRER